VTGAVKHGRAVNLDRVDPSYRGFPYYAEPCPARVLLVVPVTEGETVRGSARTASTAPLPVRSPPVSSCEAEEAARAAARSIARAVQNERVFAQIERSKAEHFRLYRASQTLGSTSRRTRSSMRSFARPRRSPSTTNASG